MLSPRLQRKSSVRPLPLLVAGHPLCRRMHTLFTRREGRASGTGREAVGAAPHQLAAAVVRGRDHVGGGSGGEV